MNADVAHAAQKRSILVTDHVNRVHLAHITRQFIPAARRSKTNALRGPFSSLSVLPAWGKSMSVTASESYRS